MAVGVVALFCDPNPAGASDGCGWVRPRVLSPNASYIILTCGLRTTNDHRTRHLKRSSPKHGLPFSPTNFFVPLQNGVQIKALTFCFPQLGLVTECIASRAARLSQASVFGGRKGARRGCCWSASRRHRCGNVETRDRELGKSWCGKRETRQFYRSMVFHTRWAVTPNSAV